MKTGVAGIVLGAISCVIAVVTAVGLRDLSNAVGEIETKLGTPNGGAKGGPGPAPGGPTAGEKAAEVKIAALESTIAKLTSDIGDLRIALGSATVTGGATTDPAALEKAVEAVLAKVNHERQLADAKRWAEKQMGNAKKSISMMENGMQLTTEQKDQLTKVLEAQFAKVAELMAASEEPGTATSTATGIREESEQQVRAILTQDQKEKFDKMDKSWLPGANPRGNPPGKGTVGPNGAPPRR